MMGKLASINRIVRPPRDELERSRSPRRRETGRDRIRTRTRVGIGIEERQRRREEKEASVESISVFVLRYIWSWSLRSTSERESRELATETLQRAGSEFSARNDTSLMLKVITTSTVCPRAGWAIPKLRPIWGAPYHAMPRPD